MTPKLGTVYDFFIMFEHVLRHLPWQYIVWWSQKWKNSAKIKNLGNSVHQRIYGHDWVYPSIYIWFLYISFVMPSSYFLLFINALIHLLSTVHCILEPKVTKRYVLIMNMCNPWLYWYILVHTRTYSYTLVYTRNPAKTNCFYGIFYDKMACTPCMSSYTAIYWDIQLYTHKYPSILVYTALYLHILICTRNYSYIRRYTFIYSHILWYTDIYCLKKVYPRIYLYVLCVSV